MRLASGHVIRHRYTVTFNEIRTVGKRGRSIEKDESENKKYRCEQEVDSSENIELVIMESSDKVVPRVPLIGLSPEYWCQYMCGPDPRIWAALDIQRAWRRRRRRRLQNTIEHLNFDGLKLS